MNAQQPDPLSYYESVAAASERMLRAAQEADWDALIEEEKTCAGLIDALRSADAERRLSGTALRRKGAILRQLLAEDAEIRRLTQPWLRQLEELLRSSNNQQRLDSSYAAQRGA